MFNKIHKKNKVQLESFKSQDQTVIKAKTTKRKVNKWIPQPIKGAAYSLEELKISEEEQARANEAAKAAMDQEMTVPPEKLEEYARSMKSTGYENELRSSITNLTENIRESERNEYEEIRAVDGFSDEDDPEVQEWTRERMNRGKVMPRTKLPFMPEENRVSKRIDDINLQDLLLEIIEKRKNIEILIKMQNERANSIKKLQSEAHEKLNKLEYESLGHVERLLLLEEIKDFYHEHSESELIEKVKKEIETNGIDNANLIRKLMQEHSEDYS